MKRIVAVAGDPGGANALAPVLARLRQDGDTALKCYAYRQAEALWSGLGCEGLPGSPDLESAEQRLAGADLLIAGTSCNGVDWEKQFFAAARKIGVPSLALLDFWANYRPRFSLPDGSWCLPDRIAVMDEEAEREMMAEGFDGARLTVTGQPAFDALEEKAARFTSQRREEIRRQLAVGDDEQLVSFASQPLRQLHQAIGPENPGLGYDERVVREALLAALEAIGKKTGKGIVLALLPHPRENPETFSGLESRQVKVRVVTDVPPLELAMASDLVTGMTSVFLVEACYLGCPVASLQPGLTTGDALPTNRLGMSVAAYRAEAVEPLLMKMLFDEEYRGALRDKLKGFRAHGGAAQRVVDLVSLLVDKNKG